MSITSEIQKLRQELPSSTRLVAVSKFHPIDEILEAYAAGQRIFGESRVQELCEKHPLLPQDIDWHFIGHLQTNKIKQIVPFVGLIHGVDSLRLLKEINKEGERVGRKVPCLLQIHVAMEETKFGFSPQECLDLVAGGALNSLDWVEIRGIMGMASLTDDMEQIRTEFRQLYDLFNRLKSVYFQNDNSFSERSMGMSDDYPIAVEEGSSLVRIGTRIFGLRHY